MLCKYDMRVKERMRRLMELIVFDYHFYLY